MANNNLIYNAALAAAAGSPSLNRWLTNPSASAYLRDRNAAIAFATAVDAAIPLDADMNDSKANLIGAICGAQLGQRVIQATDISVGVIAAIVALYNEITPALTADTENYVNPGEVLGRSLSAVGFGPAVPIAGGAVGELIRYQTEIPNSDTGTLAVLTIDERTTSIQFNPVGADLTIQTVSMPFGKTCRLRVQRTATQRVIIVNGSGANVVRCPGQADFIMQSNDECVITNSFGAPMITTNSIGPNIIKPELAPFSATPNTFWSAPFILRNTFTAGGGGAADDVTLIPAATLPFSIRVQDAWLEVSTGVVGSSVQLRNATGGLGSVLSSALASVTPATTSRNNASIPPALAANTVLVARRSDSGAAGTIFVLASRV